MEVIRRAALATVSTMRSRALDIALLAAGLTSTTAYSLLFGRGFSVIALTVHVLVLAAPFGIVMMVVFVWRCWQMPGRLSVERVESGLKELDNDESREYLLSYLAEAMMRHREVLRVAVFGSSSWLYPPTHDVDLAVLIKKTKKAKATLAKLEKFARTEFRRTFRHFGDDVHLSLHPYYDTESDRWNRLLANATNVRTLRERR